MERKAGFLSWLILIFQAVYHLGYGSWPFWVPRNSGEAYARIVGSCLEFF